LQVLNLGRVKVALAGALALLILTGIWARHRLSRPRAGATKAAGPRTGAERALDLGEAAGARLEGVVRLAGRPVADAEVSLAGPSGGRTARSAADGSFSFAALEEGRYVLRALKEEHAAYLDSVTVGARDGGAGPLEVELVHGVHVQGRLLARDGSAIPDGEVTLSEAPWTPLPRTVRSGPDGSYRFAGVLAGRHLISAHAEGFFPGEPRSVAVAGTAVQLELRLERGATLVGRVLDETGRPVSGAALEVSGEGEGGAPVAATASGSSGAGAGLARLEPAGELGILRGTIPYPPAVPAAMPPAQASARSFVTDERGSFKLIGLPAGRLVVAATHPAFLRGVSEPVETRANATASVSLVLSRGERLGGTVLDDRGVPLGGARVEVRCGSLPARIAITDGHGRFKLEGLGPAPFSVEAAHRDFASARLSSVAPADELTLTLAPGAGLSGDVRDARTGAVPSGLRLELASADHTLPLVVDKSGRFEAWALPPGRATLRASAPGYLPFARPLELPAGERPHELTVRAVSVELERGGEVTGRVRDDDGSPAANLEVTAGAVRGRTDPHGEFRLDGIAPGRVEVRVESGPRRAAEEIDVREGEESKVDLRLR
jgi:protocatechuate 3,4-dioxygenase beta subunit